MPRAVQRSLRWARIHLLAAHPATHDTPNSPGGERAQFTDAPRLAPTMTADSDRPMNYAALLAHAYHDVHASAIAAFFSSLGPPPPSIAHDPSITSAEIRNYLICFVNRSGSNLLAAGLQGTRLLGNPREYFNGPEVIEACRALGLRSLTDYARAVMRTTATPNGVFGTKVGAGQLLYLTREGIVPNVFRRPVFVYVTRLDTVSQAISFVIASQTQRWTSLMPGSDREPTYDAGAIIANLRWIYESQSLFEYYFTIHGIQPLRFIYEQLQEGLEPAVARIAAAVGVDVPRGVLSSIQLRRQRTELNEEFKARFLKDVRVGL
jgi:trehalose 2-sulfotransferase